MKNSEQLAKFEIQIINISKGIILSLWIIILIVGAFLTITGKSNDFLENLQERKGIQDWDEKPEDFADWDENKSAYETYLKYEEKQYILNSKLEIPPVNSVLDLITQNQWRSKKCTYQAIGGFAAFGRIEKILIAIASNPDVYKPEELNFIKYTLDHLCYSVVEDTDDFQLTPEILQWIKNENKYKIERTQAVNLFDTFILLIILGAFGSITFLLSDYLIESENKKNKNTKIIEYIFKPIFGMFLAISVFVLYLSTSSIISQSNPLSINSQFLYLLGLGGGLLSERYYQILVERTNKILNAEEEQTKPNFEERNSQPLISQKESVSNLSSNGTET